MRLLVVVSSLLALASFGCSSAEHGVCGAGDTSCGDASTGASVTADASADASSDASDAATDASCPPWVDEAGITHGCGRGAQGPGDRDDGGGMEAGVPDVAVDASDLPLGSPCWDNAQCASGVCYDYRAKGTFCTQACHTNADCPPPSLGCNGMGFCRAGS